MKTVYEKKVHPLVKPVIIRYVRTVTDDVIDHRTHIEWYNPNAVLTGVTIEGKPAELTGFKVKKEG